MEEPVVIVPAPVEAVEPVLPTPAPIPVPPTPVVGTIPLQPPQPLQYLFGKPGMVQAIAMMTLINGVISILWGIGVACGLLATIVCWPIGAYPIIVGILELVYAAKLLESNPRGVKPAQYLAIMEICEILFGNVFAIIGGILALVFYSNDSVKTYFSRLNSRVYE